MKKEYMKPMMENEEFVVSEYVTLCMIFTCHNDSGKCNYEVKVAKRLKKMLCLEQ